MKLFSIVSLAGVFQAAVFAAVGLVASAAMALDDFECFSDAPEGGQVCMVTPANAKATTQLKLRREGPTVSMLSERELSGEALEPVDIAGLDLDEVDDAAVPSRSVGMEAASISQSMKTQEQLRWIETFLKTGPSAGSPDILVRTTAKPSK